MPSDFALMSRPVHVHVAIISRVFRFQCFGFGCEGCFGLQESLKRMREERIDFVFVEDGLWQKVNKLIP